MERRLPQATESQRRLPAYPPDKLLQLVLTAKRIFLVKNGYYSKKIIIIICLLARLKKNTSSKCGLMSGYREGKDKVPYTPAGKAGHLSLRHAIKVS